MPSAIDMFREQREAAEQLHGRVQEISALLDRLRHQINSLALNDDLRAMLRQEQDWLTRAQLAVSEVRSFREQDMLRFWPGVIRRWAVAFVFALASAAAAGADYAWWTKPYAAELAVLRSRIEFPSSVEHRVVTMTPAERRQFDRLMKWNSPRQSGEQTDQPLRVDTWSFLPRYRECRPPSLVNELDARVTIRRHDETKPLTTPRV